jgi:hypothetical protein
LPHYVTNAVGGLFGAGWRHMPLSTKGRDTTRRVSMTWD